MSIKFGLLDLVFVPAFYVLGGIASVGTYLFVRITVDACIQLITNKE